MCHDLRTKLNEYVDNGLVIKANHPELPLSIYTYSRTTQYEGKWDDYTKMCRGLILDHSGNIVARPFNKFFNLEEYEIDYIPNEPFTVYEKLDGSLGIVFFYEGEWHVATKGSFSSDQAIKGKSILSKYNLDVLDKNYTYLFEIIYKENRIVVDYGDVEKMVLLAAIKKDVVYEEKNIHTSPYTNHFEVVPVYDGIKDFKQLKSIIPDDKEGFVVKFQNGFRLKIKGEEYVKLHRIFTQISTIDIWEYLKEGYDIDTLLEKVPDEFDKWIKKVVSSLHYAFYRHQEYVGKIYDYRMYGKYGDLTPITDRKEFAQWAQKQDEWARPILFKMFDRKPYDDYIWKLIKPKYERPFWDI